MTMRKLIVLLLAVSLTACGFQLRGSFNLPWTTFHIGQPEFSEL
jgi:outer membrane lipopolysaccharide assembly protein LptE/RlpB